MCVVNTNYKVFFGFNRTKIGQENITRSLT
jgi:hypothetical protein